MFLDEVAELPLELQSKLLRVLQERTFTPVGGTRSVSVDVRIVAATHKALREEVKAGRFREDLMYRLRVVPIFLPALRERPADVDLLFDRFVADHNARGPRRVERVSPEVRAVLRAWRWPGNVRELQNVVEYVFAVGRGPDVPIKCLPVELREAARAAKGEREPAKTDGASAEPARPTPKAEPVPVEPWKAPRDDAARVRAALEAANGHIGRAAELLGVSRPTLWRWRRRLGV